MSCTGSDCLDAVTLVDVIRFQELGFIQDRKLLILPWFGYCHDSARMLQGVGAGGGEGRESEWLPLRQWLSCVALGVFFNAKLNISFQKIVSEMSVRCGLI